MPIHLLQFWPNCRTNLVPFFVCQIWVITDAKSATNINWTLWMRNWGLGSPTFLHILIQLPLLNHSAMSSFTRHKHRIKNLNPPLPILSCNRVDLFGNTRWSLEMSTGLPGGLHKHQPNQDLIFGLLETFSWASSLFSVG